MAEIIYIDGIDRANYVWADPDGNETLYPDAFHLVITIPAERRDDVDRNDTSRRELTGILEAAIAAIED